MESEKEYYSPDGFIKNFKFYGDAVDVRVQQDATEFLSSLVEQLEWYLKTSGNGYDKLMSDVFQATCVSEVKSLDNQYPYVS